jgi:predicted alpha/beta-fold hydrolase
MKLNAADDPIIPRDLGVRILRHAPTVSPHIISVQTRRGGHTAFHEGFLPLSPLTWDIRVAVDFFRAIMTCDARNAAIGDQVGGITIAH